MSKPNILLIMTDQQSGREPCGIDNEYLNTPALNSLAKEGIRFEKAYCTQPLCVPSRNSMFTGRMPYEGNIYLNVKKSPKMKQFPYLGKLLKENGYETAYFGKWHLAPSIRFDKKIHGFDRTRLAGGGSMDLKITVPVCEYMKEDRDKPFFAVASYNNPHNICQWIRKDRPLPIKPIPDPPAKEKCPPLPPNFSIPDQEPAVIRKMWEKYRKKHYPVTDWTEEDWRQYLWAYYRLIEIVDGEIQKILDTLEEENMRKDTVVIFVSDHGEGMGEKHWTQKQVLYESTTKVPCIISQKGKTLANEKNKSHLISTGLDLFPTICDFAGVPLNRVEDHKHLWGKSLKPLTLGKKTPLEEWRTFVPGATEFGTFKLRAWNEHYNPMGRMIRTRKFKYIIYSEGESREELFSNPSNHEQLFDLENDPYEKNDLAGKPGYREILEEHRGLLLEWTRLTNDDFFEPRWIEDKSFLSKMKDVFLRK